MATHAQSFEVYRHTHKNGVVQMDEKFSPQGVQWPNRLLTEKEVALLTGISCSSLQKYRLRGIGIPYHKIGRLVRYAIEDVLAFIESHKIIPR